MRFKALLLLVTLLTGCAPLVEHDNQPISFEGTQEWLVLESKSSDAPEIVTVLSKLPATDVRAKYPVLMRVLWGYDSLANGMPTAKEILRGKELYSNLDRIIGNGGMYAMSRTGNGGRTIYYYVQDVAVHSKAIREYFDSLPPISVKVTAREEPEWDSIQKVLNGVK